MCIRDSTNAELSTFDYVFGCLAQVPYVTIRDGDVTNWAAVKAEYASRSLPSPKRLLTCRWDIFQYNSYSVELFQDANISDTIPTWAIPGITGLPTRTTVALPPTTAIDRPYRVTDNSTYLTMAEVKTILDPDYTFTNYGDNPLNETYPYEIDILGSNIRLRATRMNLTDSDWQDALVDLISAIMTDGDGDSYDGVIIGMPKDWAYSLAYQGTEGIWPDGSQHGDYFPHLELWTYTRQGGGNELATPWVSSTNTPAFPGSGGLFDTSYDVTTYDYWQCHMSLISKLVTEAAGAWEVWSCPLRDQKDVGCWQDGTDSNRFRLDWRNDYIARNGGTQDQAQTALRADVMTLATTADGLVLPSGTRENTDTYNGSVTIETAGWLASVKAAASAHQLAAT
mgnify:CR=1 FL=1